MHLKKYFLLAIHLFIFGAVYSQKNSSMSEKWNYSDRAFIKNIGQFDNRNWNSNSEIEYGYAENPFYIFFTKQGVTYRLDKMIKNPKREEDKTVFPKRTNYSQLDRFK